MSPAELGARLELGGNWRGLPGLSVALGAFVFVHTRRVGLEVGWRHAWSKSVAYPASETVRFARPVVVGGRFMSSAAMIALCWRGGRGHWRVALCPAIEAGVIVGRGLIDGKPQRRSRRFTANFGMGPSLARALGEHGALSIGGRLMYAPVRPAFSFAGAPYELWQAPRWSVGVTLGLSWSALARRGPRETRSRMSKRNHDPMTDDGSVGNGFRDD